MRRLLEDLAEPQGLVLILDDVHWADNASVELLDHLVRHPPRGRVLIAIAYRPAQASPRVAALLGSAGDRGREVPVGPLTLAEAAGTARPGREPVALPGAARGQRGQSVLPGSPGPHGTAARSS